MSTLVIAVVQAESEKNAFPVEEEVRLTVRAAARLDGLFSASWLCTVTMPEQAPTVSVCCGVAKASLVGGPALMVSTWTAAVVTADDTRTVGTPATVSRK